MSVECGDINCEKRRGGLVELIDRHGWIGGINDEGIIMFGHSCGELDCICAAATPMVTREDDDD